MDVLDEITRQRREDIALSKEHISEEELKEQITSLESSYGPPLDVLKRLNMPSKHGEKMALAAEFKRASPSKGDIAVDLDIVEQAHLYATSGASMISVLTEPKRFKGTLDDMKNVLETVHKMHDRPAILRKDFIIDAYQLLEARAYGADSVLLIVGILTPELLRQLIEATLKLGMVPLVEVNNLHELEIALEANARLIGVNNRNLRTFKLDLNRTVQIADEIRRRDIELGPNGVTLFALSGIHSREDVVKFEKCGARGILVGEFLMKSGDVKRTIEKLLHSDTHHHSNSLESLPLPLTKICGITQEKDALVALRAGANLIGLIFVETSKRCVKDLNKAKAIVEAVRAYGERDGPILPGILEERGLIKGSKQFNSKNEWFMKNSECLRDACDRAPLVVGVFANQSTSKINEIASIVGLDIVQLHGDEGFEVCAEIDLPTIRVCHLPAVVNTQGVDPEAIFQHIQGGLANFILLDTTIKGQHGGTGVTFDWKIASFFHQSRLPCLMAGGLTAENVAKAILLAVPVGVDVSSGVEIQGSPGLKDHSKVNAFVKAVKYHWTCVSSTIDEE